MGSHVRRATTSIFDTSFYTLYFFRGVCYSILRLLASSRLRLGTLWWGLRIICFDCLLSVCRETSQFGMLVIQIQASRPHSSVYGRADNMPDLATIRKEQHSRGVRLDQKATFSHGSPYSEHLAGYKSSGRSLALICFASTHHFYPYSWVDRYVFRWLRSFVRRCIGAIFSPGAQTSIGRFRRMCVLKE